MKSVVVLMLTVLVGLTNSLPEPNHRAFADSEFRDENGYISIKDLGDLLSGVCGQLSTFKETLRGSVSAGYGAQILDSPLPLPNLGALDFLGIIKIVTQGLGMALDKTSEVIAADGAIPTSSATDVTTVASGGPHFLLKVGDVVDMAEYLCKVVNLVAAVLNNKLFDILHINRITIPLKDPRHPLPDLSWVDKLDILNLRGLGKGLINAGGALIRGLSCIFGCSVATTEAPPLPEELKKPEKPSIFDDLASAYDKKK